MKTQGMFVDPINSENSLAKKLKKPFSHPARAEKHVITFSHFNGTNIVHKKTKHTHRDALGLVLKNSRCLLALYAAFKIHFSGCWKVLGSPSINTMTAQISSEKLTT